MIKKRSKKLILISLIAMLVIALSITMVFAYNVIVDYNYKFRAHDFSLSLGISNSTLIYVDSTMGELAPTEIDIILISRDETLKLNGISASQTQTFDHIDGNTYTTLVFRDMPLTSSRTFFTSSAPIEEAIKAAVSKADSPNGTVIYQNKYVGSFSELELLNFQTNYNNIFELAGNYYSKVAYSRTIYVIGNLSIDKNFTVNQPCSINTLGFFVTLNGDLTIHHSYAGSYFLESEFTFINGSINGNGNLSIKTPKAYYYVNDYLKAVLDQRLTEVYDFDSYGDLIMSDALDFAQSLIPKNVFSDLILQTQYQSFGIKYTYNIVGKSMPFSGRVSSQTDTPDNAFRGLSTQTYTLKITAQKDTLSMDRNVDLRIIGTGSSAIINYLAENFYDSFLAQTEFVYAAIDLLPLIKEVYGGGYLQDITVSIEESTEIELSDENSSKLILNDDFNTTQTVTYLDLPSYESFLLRRGTVTVSETLNIEFKSQGSIASKTFYLGKSSRAEAMYYLRSSSPAFTTNRAYPLLEIVPVYNQIEDIEKGIYLGGNSITSLTFGLNVIEYTLVLINDEGIEEIVDVADYFEVGANNNTLFIHYDIVSIPKNLYLKYTCTFEDDYQESFLLRIFQSIADDGGASQLFESNNPFDKLFMSTDTNWLEGGTFEVPGTAEMNYAHIKILSIDGATYNPNNPYNMCYIENDADAGFQTSTTDPFNFYKRIHFITDLRYVPDRNSTVKVRCYYYAFTDNISEVVLIQEYTITINGIFKCGNTVQGLNETPFVFRDTRFYNMTIELIETHYDEFSSLYVSTLSTNEKILLSDSVNANLSLDYAALNNDGTNVNPKGIERLINIPYIRLDNLIVLDMKPFESMVGTALKILSLANCQLTNSALYSAGVNKSYIFEVQLTEVVLRGNSISRTDNLLSRTVTALDISAQMQSGVRCLRDISGLESIKDLVRLDISKNAIHRFEVLKYLGNLAEVYLYDNLVTNDFNLYGTDGHVNIPTYVWIIKENSAKIFANANDLTDSGVLSIGDDPRLFSGGGEISELQLEGAIALNAFASATRLYSYDGVQILEHDYAALVVVLNGEDASGGINQPGDSDYKFKFYDIESETPVSQFVLIDGNLQKPDYIVAGSLHQPIICSYILTIVKIEQGIETVIAMREFLVYIHYSYQGY